MLVLPHVYGTIQSPCLASTPPHHSSQPTVSPPIVDISLLLKSAEDDENRSISSPASVSRSGSAPSSVTTSVAPLPPQPRSAVPAKRLLSSEDNPIQSPAKKQSKWSPEEDTKIIQLRQDGMKWEDISKHLPGRSAISCRLHYQNYLERRSEWDEDRKNRLARLYERFRADMWARVAEEMAMPWRAVEAMHWQMGEHEMAKRAGVTPFSLGNPTNTFDSMTLPPRAQFRHGPPPRLQRSSTLNELSLSGPLTGPQQLPSLAELTAGLPALTTPPYQSTDPFHHLYSNSRDRKSPF
ncbi:MYB DNA-binding domain-containing protein [Exophiala viscosa]|uniref:MYB DNA-binding domain-containing protein n=1 Tax=Exophiala viscosa TaxID=2486360 RepID=A0AAN6DY60_9EURO|nr:MYB DNA-binding domain-containing protein [Exophiala viscosa]KAI1624302.1 MYB DNA-binding domain-containing protein [Exophiala viscosa]